MARENVIRVMNIVMYSYYKSCAYTMQFRYLCVEWILNWCEITAIERAGIKRSGKIALLIPIQLLLKRIYVDRADHYFSNNLEKPLWKLTKIEFKTFVCRNPLICSPVRWRRRFNFLSWRINFTSRRLQRHLLLRHFFWDLLYKRVCHAELPE